MNKVIIWKWRLNGSDSEIVINFMKWGPLYVIA